MTQKIKVLLVEDNPINAKLLMAFMDEAEFEVIHAEDGHAGLEKMNKTPNIDVILLDRMMPGMDGLDALIRFKRLVNTGHIPVIMLTSALSTAQIADAKATGAFACLPKPYNKDLIISTIKEALKG